MLIWFSSRFSCRRANVFLGEANNSFPAKHSWKSFVILIVSKQFSWINKAALIHNMLYLIRKIRTCEFGKTTSLITFISVSWQSISVYIALQRFDGTLTEFEKHQRLSKLVRKKNTSRNIVTHFSAKCSFSFFSGDMEILINSNKSEFREWTPNAYPCYLLYQ